MLDQLGPAIASGRAVFLYGPPGNGKSVMGEGIGRVLGGDIYIPHALDVDGQIVTMFDPVAHEVARHATRKDSIIRSDTDIDGRWIRVARPVITVGGELTLEMLDLRYKELSAFYEAPVHLKANGGVLVVDDFGRQRVPARDLLNRWIVPLESQGRLPEPAHRPEIPGAVRHDGGVRDEPRAAVAGRRGVPSPHSLQDSREEPDARSVHAGSSR